MKLRWDFKEKKKKKSPNEANPLRKSNIGMQSQNLRKFKIEIF